jgi:cytochrome c-type biogenesis protein CcmH
VKRAAVLLALVVTVVAATVLAARDSGSVATVDERTHQIAAGLRCPVCLNLSVADSPSRLAGEMRDEIASRVRSGQTDEQIRAFFVDRYGEWVLLEPTRSGLNLLPWALPVTAVAAGLAVWFSLVRRRPQREEAVVSQSERRRIEHELHGLEETV